MALVEVDIRRGLKVGNDLSLEVDEVREEFIVKALHLFEGLVKELKILLFVRDVLVANLLETPKSLEGLGERRLA
jgi:hypothetical protein